MTADDEPLTSKLATLGDGGIDDSELDERVAAFKDALRRLREDPVEAARIDALVLDADREHPAQEGGPGSLYAAETFSTKQVAYAMLAGRTISGNAGTVLRAVVLRRPVEEIFRLADILHAAASSLSADFLEQAAAHIHERGDGSEAADFIDRLLNWHPGPRERSSFRADNPWRRQIAAIIDQIAGKRDPEQLASLVAGLRERRRYYEFRDDIQEAAVRYYQAADLTALIRACRHDHLPAALSILLTALQMPGTVKPVEIPAVIGALHQAGVPSQALSELLTYIGSWRRLDHGEMVAALRQAGMDDEARWMQSGHPANRAASRPDHDQQG